MAVLVTIAAVLVGLATLANKPVGPMFAAMGLLTLVYMAAGAVDTVREHPTFPFASAVHTTFLFTDGYVSDTLSDLLWVILTVLSAFGVVVEAYNYRRGTSYPQLNFE